MKTSTRLKPIPSLILFTVGTLLAITILAILTMLSSLPG
jgi:hypothetical protein